MKVHRIYAASRRRRFSKQDADNLCKQLYAAGKAVMMSPEFGFSNEEVDHYFRMNMSYENDGRVRYELGCEVSFDGLMDICEELNKYVQKYDKESYFEPVEPGIAEAWLDIPLSSGVASSMKIRKGKKYPVLAAYSSYDMLPGPGDFDPPEYPEPSLLDDVEEEFQIEVDTKIVVEADGNWDYLDQNDTDWAKDETSSDGCWYGNEYRVKLADPVEVLEGLDDILTPYIPSKSGTYHIRCYVDFVYELTSIYDYGKFGEEEYEPDVDLDDIEAELLFDKCKVTQFKFQRV